MLRIFWQRSTLSPRVAIGLPLLLAAALTLLPFVWVALNSIKSTSAIFEPGAIIPFVDFEPTFGSWREVLSDTPFLRAILSSVVVSFGTTIFALIVGVPTGYALARFQFPVASKNITLWFPLVNEIIQEPRPATTRYRTAAPRLADSRRAPRDSSRCP